MARSEQGPHKRAPDGAARPGDEDPQETKLSMAATI
jgi:hypothetical protein